MGKEDKQENKLIAFCVIIEIISTASNLVRH